MYLNSFSSTNVADQSLLFGTTPDYVLSWIGFGTAGNPSAP